MLRFSIVFVMEILLIYSLNLLGLLKLLSDEFVAFVLIAFSSIAFTVSISFYFKKRIDYVTVLTSYCIRVLLFLIDYKMDHVLPNSKGDAIGFQRAATSIANGVADSYGGLYTLLLGNIYKLTGANELIGTYINVLLSMFVILNLWKILNLLSIDVEIKRIALVLVSFLPYFTMNSVVLLRESIMIYLSSVSFYFFIRWWIKNRDLNMVFGLSVLLLATLFHSGLIGLIVGYIFAFLFYSRKTSAFRTTNKSILLGTVCVGVGGIILAFFGNEILRKFGGVQGLLDIDKIQRIANLSTTYFADAGATYSIGFETGNQLVDIIVSTPLRIFYFLLSPMPWDWRGVPDILAFFGSSVLYGYAYFITFKALKSKKIDRGTKSLLQVFLMMALTSAIIFAWGVTNSGTALRHREKFICVYLVMSVVSVQVLCNKKKIPKIRW